jgi:hypothetical protein
MSPVQLNDEGNKNVKQEIAAAVVENEDLRNSSQPITLHF